MRIVLAPDSFKESMTAYQACVAMRAGVKRIFPDADVICVPMADGGEGTVDALVAAKEGALFETQVRGPLGSYHLANIGLIGGLAVIEVAEAVGINRVGLADRDVWKANTEGVADLLNAALGQGAERIIVGLGGTGTNDAGAGFLVGMGASLLDVNGREVPPDLAHLHQIETVDLSAVKLSDDVEIDLACDVTNPLLGHNGCSAVFGPQKGLRYGDIQQADQGIERFVGALETAVGRPLRGIAGAGAAGGLGVAFLALGAKMRSGVETVAAAAGLEEALIGADLMLTGEGSIDGQTLQGKTLMGVVALARDAGVQTIGFGGRVTADADELLAHGFSALIPITTQVGSLQKAIEDGPRNLMLAVCNTMRLLKLGMSCGKGSNVE